MKFSCERCQTRYSIGDEKVHGKVLKIRCKTCGNIIVVREPVEASASQASSLSLSASASAAAGPSQPQLSPSRVQQSPLQPSQPSLSAGQARAPIARPGDNIDWYVAVKGKQHGPCKKDDVVRLFREGKITDRTYLWNEAMPAWARLREVPQFSSLLIESAPPKRPPPPPPSDEQQSAGAEIIPFDDIKRARDNATGVGNNSALQNDPFAAVSQPMLGGDASPRDSTRVFIMQAGLANRGRKHRLYGFVAAGVVALAAGVFVGDWQGLFEIPGLHNVVSAVVQRHDEPKKIINPGAAWDDTEEDPALKCKLAGALYDDCVKKIVAENVVKRAHHVSKGGGTVAPDLSGAFNTAGPGSDAIARAGTGEVASGPLAGGLSAADAAAVLALKKDEKKAAQVKLVIPSDTQPQIDGQDLDPKNVALVVKENTPAIQDCIEKAAKSGVLPHGKQWLVVGVEPNGRVSSARFKDGATSASDAGECIARSAKKWKFAPFPGPPTDAEIPLLFSISELKSR